jgi:micrococcal nuclease
MYEYNARVKRVVDGDTVDFVVDLGFNIHTTIRTRLIGVDTPERGHEDWKKATETCARLLSSVADIRNESIGHPEHWVKIRTEKTGKYGRWLVEIDGVTDELAKIWPYKR